jgi:hypothetical protein
MRGTSVKLDEKLLGSLQEEMREIGHFSMSEDHGRFMSYVSSILGEIRSADRVSETV